MQEQRKRWLSLGVALASGVSLSAAAADLAPAHGAHEPAMALAMASEGEGGEGEGAAGGGSLETDDQAYLTRLGLIRGHLRVGYELYRDGHKEMAVTHMKHPRDELYAGLVPAIAVRDADTFDAELSALAERVIADAGRTAVDEAYAALEKAIIEAESAADASLRLALLSVMDLVRTAGEEYALGVEDGRLVNRHEYQDAYGFTEIAKQRLMKLPAATRAESPEAVAQVISLLEALRDLWPDIAPGDSVDGDASRLYGAAARIEIAALGV